MRTIRARTGFKVFVTAALACVVVSLGFLPAPMQASTDDEQQIRLTRPRAYDAHHVLVRVSPGVQAASVLPSDAESIGLNWYKVRVPRGQTVSTATAVLTQNPAIEEVEPDYIVRLDPPTTRHRLHSVVVLQAGSTIEPDDPYYSYQWHFPHVQAPHAWTKSTGAGVTVAVIDTGVSKGGQDLACHTFVHEYNAITGSTGPGAANDDHGHGTHVAGTIAQCTNNSIGVAGLAYQATLMPVKVLDSSGSGAMSDVAKGLNWARERGADVINLSLGMSCNNTWPTCSSNVVNSALQAAAAADIVSVAASGNESKSYVSFPANHPDVIAVGAINSDNQRASFSNYGSALSVVAPGVWVLQETFVNDEWGIGILTSI